MSKSERNKHHAWVCGAQALGAGVQSLALQTLVSALRQVWEKSDPFMSGCSKLSQQPRLPKELPCGYNRLASRAFGHKLEKPVGPLSSHQGEGGRADPGGKLSAVKLRLRGTSGSH